MARAKVVIIVIPTACGDVIHFTKGPLQKTAAGTPLHFPLAKGADLFQTVEAIMQLHQVAFNVTHIEKIREVGLSVDYEVTYNEFRTSTNAEGQIRGAGHD